MSVVIEAPYPHYTWPAVDPLLELRVVKQLRRSLSERDRSGVIGEYEERLGEFFGTKHALSFSSGTCALHAICVACGLGPGDEVLAPTYTFFATASPFAFEGVTVKFCDADAFGNLSVESLRNNVGPATKAVILTHMWGVPCDMRKIVDFCREHGLRLIEDCSHAHLATFEGQQVGTFGDIGVFSTNQKVLTTGEGGFAITNDIELFEEMLLVGHYNHRCRQELRKGSAHSAYALTGYGLKYRMLPLSAAIGLHQLERLDEIEDRRRANYQVLARAVESTDLFQVPTPAYAHEHGLYVFSFLVREGVANQRDTVVAHMQGLGGAEFDAPGSTKPIHNEPLFCQGRSGKPLTPTNASFPGADDFYRRLIKCPLWGYTGDEAFVQGYAQIIGMSGQR